MITPVLIYESETQVLTQKDESQIQAIEIKLLDMLKNAQSYIILETKIKGTSSDINNVGEFIA